MIYTVQNTVNIGRVVKAIYDRNGQLIPGRSLKCNTETGEVFQHRTDDCGRYVLRNNRTELVVVRMIFQKPLRVEFVES